MSNKIHIIEVLVFLSLLAMNSDIQADPIWFPSFITNGSFEEWQHNNPVGWQSHGFVFASPTDPFLGQYAVELTNNMPFDGYLYQDISYQGGSLFFGCAHWSWNNWGDKIYVRYFDSGMNEISYQSWDSRSGDWQIILTILHPPEGTATIRIELAPMLDAIGTLIVDHVFLIPAGFVD